jgi:hypothetical protein
MKHYQCCLGHMWPCVSCRLVNLTSMHASIVMGLELITLVICTTVQLKFYTSSEGTEDN